MDNVRNFTGQRRMYYETAEKLWWITKYLAGSTLREMCDAFLVEHPTRSKPRPLTIVHCGRWFKWMGNVNEVKKGRHVPSRQTMNPMLMLAAMATTHPSLRGRLRTQEFHCNREWCKFFMNTSTKITMWRSIKNYGQETSLDDTNLRPWRLNGVM